MSEIQVVEFQNATIYRVSEMMGNIVKVEVRSGSVKVAPYAQYSDAMHLKYVPKGKRSIRGSVVTSYKPYLVVIPGHGHPTPNDLFSQGTPMGEHMIQAQYRSFNSRWVSDWIDTLSGYLAAKEVKPLFARVDPEFFV